MTTQTPNDDVLEISDKHASDYPSLSIVIVNWNSKDYLRECLKSIYQYASDLNPEIIVVDGASYDGCGDMLSTEFPEVIFIQSDENIGFGRCNNLGVERATSDFLLLLNPDTEIKPNSIHALLAAYETLPRNSMLGARLLNTDGSLQTTSVHAAPTPLNQALGTRILMRMFPRSKLWGTYDAYHSNTPTNVEAISGACMFLPAQLFRQVGGFNPIYFMYAEDMDLCLKVRRNRSKIFHIPASKITHHGESSSEQQVSEFSLIKMKESIYMYFFHNYNSTHSDLFIIILLFACTSKYLISTIAIQINRARANHRVKISQKRSITLIKWILSKLLNPSAIIHPKSPKNLEIVQ